METLRGAQGPSRKGKGVQILFLTLGTPQIRAGDGSARPTAVWPGRPAQGRQRGSGTSWRPFGGWTVPLVTLFTCHPSTSHRPGFCPPLALASPRAAHQEPPRLCQPLDTMTDSGSHGQGLREAQLPSLDGSGALQVQVRVSDELPRRRDARKVWRRLRPELEKLP